MIVIEVQFHGNMTYARCREFSAQSTTGAHAVSMVLDKLTKKDKDVKDGDQWMTSDGNMSGYIGESTKKKRRSRKRVKFQPQPML